MVYRRFTMIMLMAFCTSAVFSQSCIIYKKERDGIYIGVDARMILYSVSNSKGRVESSYVSMCKIDRVKNISFAVTGHAANVAMDEARYLLNAEPEFPAAITRYTKAFGQKLADMLETDRLTNIEQFRKKFVAGSLLGGAVFVYYENGVLTGRVIRIRLTTQPSEKATVSTDNYPIDSIGITPGAIGTRNVILKPNVWKKGAVHGINNLINIEKMANPSEFEGVVDILFISSKNEMEWVQGRKCR